MNHRAKIAVLGHFGRVSKSGMLVA